MRWMKRQTEIKWINIEKEMATISLGTLPFIGKTIWKKYTGQSYCIQNTLANWKQICKTLKIDNECILLREMADDPDFMPNRCDKILDVWARKGLVNYYQLLTNYMVNSYEVITTKYELDPKHFFKYLQVRSYIRKH